MTAFVCNTCGDAASASAQKENGTTIYSCAYHYDKIYNP